MIYLRRSLEKICLEKYLTRSECEKLIRDNNMDSLSNLCRTSNIPQDIFITTKFSLDKIYATKKDWIYFLNHRDVLTDPSANAISHYLNPDNSRIRTNGIFFTDSTSGVSLLNPRFTYLINGLNIKLKNKFPNIHNKIGVISVPSTAAEIENYYTEQSIHVSFSLSISYNDNNKTVQIKPSVEETTTLLQQALRDRSYNATSLSNIADNQVIHNNAISNDQQLFLKYYNAIKHFIDDLGDNIDKINDIVKNRRLFIKSVQDQIQNLVSDEVYPALHSLIKTGSLKYDNMSFTFSNKSLMGSDLKEQLNQKLDYYKNKLNPSEIHLSSDIDYNDNNSNIELEQYIDFISKEIQDIYTFVTDNPRNTEGKIPAGIITKYRNNNALLYVLCPDSKDAQHRCCYVSSVGEDVRTLKYSFNAAGTSANSFVVEDGKLVVKTL